MSDAKFVAVTDASFNEQVLAASGPVLLKFEAACGGPCQAMRAMMWKALSQRYIFSVLFQNFSHVVIRRNKKTSQA